ncbi:MAG TPA: OmpH family outer membrane protein [Bryobacteraceae bacterium]|nr:OmpH family outer membrane protein [Bryobacteraceae bacterium]
MKKQPVFMLFLIAAAAFGQAPAAHAAPPPASPALQPGKVGVIEIQAAILNTKDGQKASAQFKVKFDPRQKELNGKAQEIRDLQNKLQSGGAALSDTAKQDLQRNLEEKQKRYQRDVEDAQAEFQSEQQRVLGDLEQRMTQVIDKYAQANGYAVIIDVSNPQTPVMYAAPNVNITKDIIELYDKSASSGAAPASRAPAPAPSKPATPVKKQP